VRSFSSISSEGIVKSMGWLRALMPWYR
jgi:hypothetical protein